MGTFQSLSLEPAPVGFSVARTSGSRPRVRAGGRFTAGVLSARRHRVCRASARKAEDEFAAVDWTASGSGRPRAAGGRPLGLPRTVDAAGGFQRGGGGTG
ncbi:flavin reductase [Nocardiopsis composta]